MVIGFFLELKPISFISYLNVPEDNESGKVIVTAFELVSTPIISSLVVAVYVVVETVVMFNDDVTFTSILNITTVSTTTYTATTSDEILGEYMIADGTYPFAKTLGIATEDIADGDVLYVSPTIPGGLTAVEPNAPNQVLEMGVVLNADINGSIFVDRHLSTKLGDISEYKPLVRLMVI